MRCKPVSQREPATCFIRVKVLEQQADLQGLIAKDSNPSLQAFQINIHLGDAEKRQAAIPLPPSDDFDDSEE